MKRRTILWMPLLGLFSSAAFSKTDRIVPKLNAQTRAIFADLSTIFKDPSNAAAIGREYLSGDSGLLSSDQLLLNMGVTSHAQSDSISMFEKQRSEDYRLSNVVNIDGWVLSKAEVSLCCSTALLLMNA